MYFIAASIRQKCKYEFGYKFNAEHMGIQKIVLPIDADGRPDYSFMRDYMRWVEWRMLAVYGKYLGIRIANIVKGPSSRAT